MNWDIANKNFYRQGLRAFLNVLVTALSIIALIFMLSLLNGFQAQATRMISVIAEQTAKIESNKKRKRWLREVSKQYEALHEDIVASVEGCRVGAT